MKALILNSYKDSAFKEVQIDKPVIEAGKVLVKIHASGVNPIDFKIRKGLAPYAMPELPAVLGTDMAGIVEAVGDDVTSFLPGDEVYGLTGGVRGLQGSLTEYALVDPALIAKKPNNLSMREAAAIPLTFLTAWEGLVDAAKVSSGKKVLVLGGAGGVGNMVVQIAKSFDAKVYATVSERKRASVERFGATAIDYSNTSVADYVDEYTKGTGFDIVYDTIGNLDEAFKAISQYGHIASCAAFSEQNLATGSLRSMTLSGVFVLYPMLSGRARAHHGDILREATRLAENSALKPILANQRFSLSEALQAHDLVESGSATGKVVIDIISE